MEILTLNISHYKQVLAFYQAQLEFLERKEFFYPYEDNDLKMILDNGGIMLGALDNGNIVGLSAVDYDPIYAQYLKQVVNTFYPYVDQNTMVYEYSGVMTDARYRNKGIASMLYQQLMQKVKKNICLCAVIQLENQASLSFFFKRNFRLVSVNRDHNIDFGYLIKFTDKEFPVDQNDFLEIYCLDFTKYRKYLNRGYAGVYFENNKIKMCKVI
ncbi:MAG TPA: GNAT family N-acetyltransferase [Clostridia bacterium]